MGAQFTIYCGGCRRKLAEGDGTFFKAKCPNCKSVTTVEPGARLPRVADHVARAAREEATTDNT